MDKAEIDPFIAAFVESTFKGMQELVHKGEEVCPQVILFADEAGSQAIIPLIGVNQYFQSKEVKSLLRPVVKKAWEGISASRRGLKLQAVLMLTDTWVQVLSTDEWHKRVAAGHPSLANKPGMGEALVIQISLADRDINCAWSYVRGKEEVVFADAPKRMVSLNDQSKGVLMGLWPL